MADMYIDQQGRVVERLEDTDIFSNKEICSRCIYKNANNACMLRREGPVGEFCGMFNYFVEVKDE